MKQFRFTFLLFFSSLSIIFTSFAQAQVFDELRNARENIVFPELSDAEKRVVAEQSQLLLQGFHRNVICI